VQIRVETKKSTGGRYESPVSTRPTQKGEFVSRSAEYMNNQNTQTQHHIFQHDSAKPPPSDDAHHNITSRASTLK